MKKTKHPLTRDRARRDYEEALLRYALLEAQERQADRAVAAYIPIPGEEETLRARVMSALGRGGAWRDAMRLAKAALPRIGKALAVLLIIFAIGMPAAIATVQPVRARVMELIFEIEREYTRVSLRERPGAGVEVPAEWGGEYYPSYIPEGYEVDEVVNMTGNKYVLYTSQKEREERFRFSEMGEDSVSGIDTENARIKYIVVNGNPGLIAEKDERTVVSWAEFDRYFVVSGNLSGEAAIQIADSVVRIK